MEKNKRTIDFMVRKTGPVGVVDLRNVKLNKAKITSVIDLKSIAENKEKKPIKNFVLPAKKIPKPQLAKPKVEIPKKKEMKSKRYVDNSKSRIVNSEKPLNVNFLESGVDDGILPQKTKFKTQPNPEPKLKIKAKKKIKKARRTFFANPKKFARNPFIFFILICALSVSSIRALAFFQGDLLEKKNLIMGNAEMAYQYMESGKNSILSKDYDLASYKFNVASDRFVTAEKELNVVGDRIINIISVLPLGNQVAAADNLLEAGSNIAVAADYTAKALQPFMFTQGLIDSLNTEKQEEVKKISDMSFTQAMVSANQNLVLALEKIKASEDNLSKVNVDVLPENIRQQVSTLKDQVPQLRYVLEQYLAYSDVTLRVLGHDNIKKYLFLFQNNRELRATGGFIGTYGLFDINEGKVQDIKIEGPYHIDGQLLKNIIPPEPMQLIVPRFYMRDANWFADFPTSAEKISSMFEKSGGPTVDGTIAITSNFMYELLKVVGPIELPEYGKTITFENFYVETQKEVEFEYDKEENRPKKFLADMFPLLIDKISALDKDKWSQLLNVFYQGLNKKEILFNFKDQELQNLVLDYGWGGKLIDTDKDYLNIVTSNIGGGKTDNVITQDSFLETNIMDDGTIVNTLTISRKHNGKPGDMFEDIKNVSYVRFYVPLGSELLDAQGFDDWFFNALKPLEKDPIVDTLIDSIEGNKTIDEFSKTRTEVETGKTVFGNWMAVEPGEEKVARIKYKLPFKLAINDATPVQTYSLVLQKQSGSVFRSLSGKVNVPEKWLNIWDYLTAGTVSPGLEYTTKIDRDRVMGLIFVDNSK